MIFRTTILALAALAPCYAAGAALLTGGERDPEPTWYVAHLGAEPCVPVTDIGLNMERVYYQSGPYRTPDDLRAAWKLTAIAEGAKVSDWRPNMRPGVRAFEISFQKLDTWIMFFADHDDCLDAMAHAPK